MIYTKLTILALNTAYEAHAEQRDRSGLPYIFHPYHVAEQMTGEYETAAALLHDVVEDTPMTLDDLRRLGFPEEVVHAVDLLTHRDTDDYFDYVRKIKSDSIAMAVKLADLAHNSDVTRLEHPTQRDIDRLTKYNHARNILLGNAD